MVTKKSNPSQALILNGKLIWQKKKRRRKVGGEGEGVGGKGESWERKGRGKKTQGRRAHSHCFTKGDAVGKRSQQ